jgi:hypothetical protein
LRKAKEEGEERKRRRRIYSYSTKTIRRAGMKIGWRCRRSCGCAKVGYIVCHMMCVSRGGGGGREERRRRT